ncbi:Aspartate aminotransferase [Thioalkalivibrio nitratireducens DSM 14787]|uniref:Aminotransferase n=1 Tax=Thioalkalivibrio nitratireducens (strain DSM 14787 / UNIQEM 213 / ALEN2) TaxID=1255043 RepID=L0DU96_THIND|nr:aminotransferase class I/II-fold pyridoxal phosphate-dependent enzyme [Thioalkalivibrio nitratireducens]AGA32570.1 Aspartate aminotransferase [Thioalkalivibrio nitratireducens DSM 14787]
MTTLSARAQALEPFRVMQILSQAQEREAAGADVIHLEVGEPDFPTPGPIVAAAQRALAAGRTRYTAAHGTTALRRAIADDYWRRFGLDLDPERVVVTAGASAAILLALAAGTDPGDGVLLPDPGYACNRQFVHALGARAELLPVTAEQDFQPTAGHIAAAWSAETRAVMLASPSNPTGTLLPAAEIAAISETVCARDGVLIVDEIYSRLVFDGPPQTALAVAPNALILNSFSKYYAMTGWRLGWMIVPETWTEPVRRLAQNLFVAPSTLAQEAALAAFDPETEALLQAQVRELGDRRDFLLSTLPSLGLPVRARPGGAFYIYADSTGHGLDSDALCARLLQEAAVALTPGTDFSPSSGADHLRVAYTQPRERLAEAVARIDRVLAR